MKKANKTKRDELRPEYKRSDFSGPLERGKLACRFKEATNVVVLRPEVAAVFTDDDAVNEALLSLIKLAKSSASTSKRAGARQKKRAA